MLELVLFHSEDSDCLSYQKAVNTVEAVQKKFGDQLGLEVHTTDSEMGGAYNCRGSIALFVNQKLVDLEIATSTEKMEEYLNGILSSSVHQRWCSLH